MPNTHFVFEFLKFFISKKFIGNVRKLRNAKIGLFDPLPSIVTQNPTNYFSSVMYCHKFQTTSPLERYVL